MSSNLSGSVEKYRLAVYAGEPEAIGAKIRIDGQSLTIVGIAPPDFSFPR